MHRLYEPEAEALSNTIDLFVFMRFYSRIHADKNGTILKLDIL
jgi:hypothetical protein